ncbi:CaiB/BaiF CoA transferase family protein [Oceanibaculum nanhaiense]|uniref:CaiB/BaiF CoA transferase family protein n=1 Tax=Oceanibaculum nanhaiense TaxID=1909734 RepID=UPI003F70F7F3
MADTAANPAGGAFGALNGLKVIDLTRVLGGPYGTQILGDHGAEIVKIEPPQGDEVRDWGPPFLEGDASYFIGVNRNKRSLGLDLSKPEGREVLLRLLDGADVLIENYKPGTMERWGIGYEEVLSKRFPALIHCRISGFGSDGPLGGFPGYDAVIQAMAGMFSINGTPEAGPTRMGTPLVDLGTGLYSAIAILMALFERQRSGKGQYIDMTLYDSAVALLHPQAANYFLSGKTPVLTGSEHPNITPYDKFATSTGEIFLAIGNNRAFERFCTEIGRPDLPADARFASNGERTINRPALRAELEKAMANVDGKALCERLLALGVPAGPVMNIAEVFAAPHTQHRRMDETLDAYRGTGIPIKFSRTPGSVRRTPPKFAQHSDEILAEAGFSAEEVASLKQGDVVVTKRRQ